MEPGRRMPTIKRIMCPVDFSETGAAGAREAGALARAAGAELLLVHVLHEPWLSSHDHGYSAPIAQQYQLIVRRKLELAALAVAPLARVRSLLIYGPVDEAIADTASRQGADLIVMGTKPRRGLASLLIDSTTERVMRRARVPVVRVCPSARRRPPLGFAHGTA
jgi:universal stress protein A